jgi:hypothetical protein
MARRKSVEATGMDKLLAEPGLAWDEADKPARDPKKLFLVIGLGILSWVATYVGMLELIEANMGELPLIHKLIIGFSVAMLMTMIIWLLDQLFAPIGSFTKSLYAAGYVFLTLISVGFGFGFYWKVLESRSEASRSAESAITQVQGSLFAAATRLEQLQGTLDQLTTVSTQKAEIERQSGTSCPNSKPGDGPRRKMREDDAVRFKFASDFVRGRATTVRGEMTALDADLVKIVKDDKSTIDAKTGTRNDFLRQVGRKLDMTVTGFNAFRTDPQLKQIRADLAERADKTSIPDGRGGQISCPDAQLQTALKGVVRAIDQLPDLEKPKIAAVEGSEATVEAFRRLIATFTGALTFKMPPTADELRDLQKKAVQSVETTAPAQRLAYAEQAGLSKRDYIPLSIALFVDLCLLLVSMGRPVNRLHGLVPKMRDAERGPVYQILSRFTDIHKDPDIREKFEVFRHVVFDYANDYYAAIPLNAPRTVVHFERMTDPKRRRAIVVERRRIVTDAERHDLQLEAHLLSNLFASFERERVFTRIDTRVVSKLLRTEPNAEAARRKLRKQGSKFADAETFRIYKFADGAWSEIILGAIMGAARRVETEKRARRIEDSFSLAGGSARPDPALVMPAPTAAPIASPQPPVASPAPVRTGAPVAEALQARVFDDPRIVQHPAAAQRRTRTAPHVATPPSLGATAVAVAPDTYTPPWSEPAPEPAAVMELATEPVAVVESQPQTILAPTEAPTPAPEMQVEAVRETIRWSVPAGEVESRLAAALQQYRQDSTGEPEAEPMTALPAPVEAQPAPIDIRAADIATIETSVSTRTSTTFADDPNTTRSSWDPSDESIRSIASRLAPSTARK